MEVEQFYGLTQCNIVWEFLRANDRDNSFVHYSSFYSYAHV